MLLFEKISSIREAKGCSYLAKRDRDESIEDLRGHDRCANDVNVAM